ncbi:acetylxylan esterase, partial [Streptomyces sp. NPDC096080]|uniref:acetylxylan esterase n=1 Tax=Streptomyces sp. NPDC096080 TaxID=3156693 RepID=UPI00331F95E9
MALFDLSLDELRAYRSDSTAPDDFDAFWSTTLAETRAHDLDARFEPVDTGLTTVDVFDVTFNGFGGHPVKGWLTQRAVPVTTCGPAGAGRLRPTDSPARGASTWVT